MNNRPIHAAVLTLLAATLVASCGSTTRSAERQTYSGEGQRFSAEQVQRSGATNAWQAVQALASHIQFREDRVGRPSRVTRRGQESLLLSENPIVVIDGAVSEFRLLEQLPVRDVHEIRILTGTQATTRFGMRAAGGAILVVTVGRAGDTGS